MCVGSKVYVCAKRGIKFTYPWNIWKRGVSKIIICVSWIGTCDKSRNTRLCVHWQWNTLERCQLNAWQAKPLVACPSRHGLYRIGCWLYTDHYSNVIMGSIASQITSLMIVYSSVYSGSDEFPAQRASNAENVSIWWRHHDNELITTQNCLTVYITIYNLIMQWVYGQSMESWGCCTPTQSVGLGFGCMLFCWWMSLFIVLLNLIT